MSTITRRRLARGTKLTTQHVHNPMTAAATALSGQIDAVQMDRPHGPFHVMLPFPSIDGQNLYTPAGSAETSEVGVSFPLLPLQQQPQAGTTGGFSATGVVAANTPIPILDSVMISWDQRDESCTITDLLDATPGYMDFGASATFDITVRMTKKRMLCFDSTAPLVPEQEIFSITIPSTAYMSDVLRLNPQVIPVGPKQLDPYCTYTVWVSAPNIGDPAVQSHCLPSFTVDLRGRYPLHRRDINDTAVPLRNAPTKHLGARAPATVALTVPAAGSEIEADTDDGLNTNLRVLDQTLLGKLRGGYAPEGDLGPNEHLRDDACYAVIAVPCWGGLGLVRNNAGVLAALPYASALAPAYSNAFPFRLPFPITYPMVLHHVVAMEDWSARPGLNYPKPNSANYVTTIQVALLSGCRADRYGYQLLAHLQYVGTDAARAWHSIDRIKHQANGTQSNGAYDQALYQMPLVYYRNGPYGTMCPNTFPGVPYNNTGTPIWVGKTWGATSTRSNLPTTLDDPGAPAAGRGDEQFIEVRWQFQDATAGLAAHPANTVFVGGAGHWVFLYFRNHLVGER